MKGRGARTIVTGALIALIAAVGALAAIDPSDYRLTQKDQLLPAETPVTVEARCAKRHRALPAGAFVHPKGDRQPSWDLALNAAVPNSAPLGRGKAWRIGAFKGAGDDLRVHLTALCAPRRQLRGAEVVRERFEVATPEAGGGEAACPNRMRVVSGGVLWHAPGSQTPVSEMLQTSSSTPARGGRGWYGDGRNFGPVGLVLDVIAVCLPKRRLQDVRRRSRDVPYPAYSQGFGGSVTCPGPRRVLTGGASWHRAGQPSDPEDAVGTAISSSTPTGDARRWYADGVNFIGPVDARLRISVVCIPK